MGFDYFFFGRALAVAVEPAAEFCLGMPWWDYWLPALALGSGAPASKTDAPVGFHVAHPCAWSRADHERYARVFVERVLRRPGMDAPAEVARLAGQAPLDAVALAGAVVRWLYGAAPLRVAP
jgi:hypothetical protein